MVPNAGDSLSGGPSQGLLGSFVIPCFREEASVRRTLTKLDALARSKPDLDWEIIVVDDGSDDATADEAADAGAVVTTPVRLLRHRRNAGLGAAMRTGIQSSRGDVVVAVDCDLSYGIDDIERLIDTWLVCHPHIVIASPYMDGGRTERVPHALEVRSRAANRFLNFAAYLTFDLPDATLRLVGESVMYGHHPTTRNALNLVRNTGMAVRMLTFGRRPDVIVSTGAGLALPFFVVGKLLRIPTVYLEVLDRFDTGTLTGRLCRPFADEFCVQVDAQTAVYPGACVIGPVL